MVNLLGIVLKAAMAPDRHHVHRAGPGVWMHIWPAVGESAPKVTRCNSWREAMIEVENGEPGDV